MNNNNVRLYTPKKNRSTNVIQSLTSYNIFISLEQSQYPVAKNSSFVSGQRRTYKAAQAHTWATIYPFPYAHPCPFQTVIPQEGHLPAL